MKNIEIFKGDWTIDDITNNPDKVFVFSDNFLKHGGIGRHLPNSIGLRIKKGPNAKSVSYYTDNDINDFKKIIFEDIIKIKKQLLSGKKLVLSGSGYGKLDVAQKSPVVYQYICQMLKDHFNFDNQTCNFWTRIPSHIELSNAKVLPIDNLIDQSSIFESIKSGYKICITSDIEFKSNDLIKLVSSKSKTSSIICRIIDNSYSFNIISKEDWSILERCDLKYYDSIGKNQFQSHFQYICSIDKKGVMIFNDDMFGNSEKTIKLPEVNEKENDITPSLKTEIVESVENPILDLPKHITISDHKIDSILEKLEFMSNRLSLIEESVKFTDKKEKKSKSFFNKKQISDFIKKWEIEGKLCLINNDKNDIYTLTNDTHFYIIELIHGKIWNDCKIVKKIERLKLEYNIIDVFSQIYLVIKDEDPILLSNSIFIKNGQLSIDYINNQIC
jgi:hypothetical protein